MLTRTEWGEDDRKTWARILKKTGPIDDQLRSRPTFHCFRHIDESALAEWLGRLESPYEFAPDQSIEFSSMGRDLLIVLSGAVLVYQEAFRTTKGATKIESCSINGKLRFHGDYLNEFNAITLQGGGQKPLPVKMQSLQKTLLLRVPNRILLGYSSSGPDGVRDALGSTIGERLREDIPRGMASKVRRQAEWEGRLYGLKAALKEKALVLDALCQFGHPAFSKDAVEQSRNGELWPFLRWFIRLRINLKKEWIGALLNQSEDAMRKQIHGFGLINSRSKTFIAECMRSYDRLNRTKATFTSDEIITLFHKSNLVANDPQEPVAAIAKTGNLNTALVFLPTFAPHELLMQLDALLQTREDPSEHEHLKNMYALVRCLRISLVHPLRYTLSPNPVPAGLTPIEQAELDSFMLRFGTWVGTIREAEPRESASRNGDATSAETELITPRVLEAANVHCCFHLSDLKPPRAAPGKPR